MGRAHTESTGSSFGFNSEFTRPQPAEVTDLSWTRHLSILRLARIFRVLRVINTLDRLNHLVHAFVHALSSVFWVLVLMLLCLYTFGVLACSSFRKEKGSGTADVDDWFGTLPRFGNL